MDIERLFNLWQHVLPPDKEDPTEHADEEEPDHDADDVDVDHLGDAAGLRLGAFAAHRILEAVPQLLAQGLRDADGLAARRVVDLRLHAR